MAIDGTLPLSWDNAVANFIAANGVQAKILVDVSAPQVVTAIAGETALPYETAARQRILQGGTRVIDGLVSSSDTVARDLMIYTAQQASLYANMGVVTTTATGNSTITRTVGSFITDGYQVGEQIMAFGAVSNANNGSVAVVTAVAALTLTLSGVAAISVAETQLAGFRLLRVAGAVRKAIAVGAGTNGTAGAIALIGGSLDPRTDNSPYGIMLGQNGMLLVAMQAAISALPAVVSVSAHFGRY